MIVFDSSTLILLAKTELLDVLLADYNGVIAMPEAVREESVKKAEFDGMLIKKRVEEGKIRVKTVAGENTSVIMQDFSIGQGEAEAIQLAAKSGGLLATDDRNAMNACKVLNIPFTTAIGMLVRMREKRLIQRDAALLKLGLLSKYGRYRKEIIQDARGRLGGD